MSFLPPRFVRDAVFRVRGSDAARTRVARIALDVTAEREAEQARQLPRVTRMVETTREEQQRRIARELHDELGQVLTGVKLTLGSLVQRGETHPRDLRALEACTDEIDGALGALSALLSRLRPVPLERLGLVEAIRECADAFSQHSGLACSLDLPPAEPDLADEERIALFRVTQKALTNVGRHAAASCVSVTLRADASAASLTVTDDGRGVDGSAPGWGIRGMMKRAALLGGTCRLEPGPSGRTVVHLELPRAGAAS